MFFKNMESILKSYSDRNLKVLEHYYGIELELYRAIKDVHKDVYGSSAGNKITLEDEFVGVLVSDDFFPASGAYAGNFQEGFLYTTYKGVKVADILKIKSSDSKQRRFKVKDMEKLGTQNSVFTRWTISNLGD